jgi:hypothetical protein
VGLLAVAGQFDQQFTVPVRRDAGEVVMMMPSPVPAIEDPELARSAGLQWHVDLELLGSAMPRGRGLDGQALFAPGENTRLTHVRSGRDAITYNAGLLTYVKAGTTPLSSWRGPGCGNRGWPSGHGSSPGSQGCPSGSRPPDGTPRPSGGYGKAATVSSGHSQGSCCPSFAPSRCPRPSRRPRTRTGKGSSC